MLRNSDVSILMQVLMATNRIDILDAALLRPGRIDRKIEFPNPNESSRFDILKIHSRKMNLMRGIDLRKIADRMPGGQSASRSLPVQHCAMATLRARRLGRTSADALRQTVRL